MYNFYKKLLVYLALIYSGICLHQDQNTELYQADDEVLELTEIGVAYFTMEWLLTAFNGESESFTIYNSANEESEESTCSLDVKEHCPDQICTFVSPTPDCSVSYSPCQDVTVSVTKDDIQHNISFTLAPNIRNLPSLSLNENKDEATLSWAGPIPDNFTDCATSVRVELQVGSGNDWINETFIEYTSTSHTWTLDDCQHGALSARVIYLYVTDDYYIDTDIVLNAKETLDYAGAGGVTTVDIIPSDQICSLEASWKAACPDEGKKYKVTWDTGKYYVTPNNSYTIPELVSQKYTVYVQASWSDDGIETGGNKPGTPTSVTPEAPDEPEVNSIQADDNTPNKLIVSWIAPFTPACIGDIFGYNITCGDEPSYEVDVDASPYNLTCLKVCTEYTVSVTANGAGGTGLTGTNKTKTGSQAPGKLKPTIPSHGHTTISLNWEEPDITKSCPLTEYNITWTLKNVTAGTDKVGNDVHSYPIKGLTCNTEYTITVTAKTEDNKPSVSDGITQNTTDKTPEAPTVKILLPGKDNSKLDVTWSGPDNYDCTGGLGKYKISWTAKGDGSPTGTADVAESPPYTITGLAHCTPYTVNVQARSNTGTLGPQGVNKTTNTTADPPGPPDIEEENIKPGTENITLRWSSSDTSKSCQLIGYTVNWMPGNGTNDAGLSNTNTITGLICNKDYTVKVTATAEDNSNSPADEVVTKTNDTAPEQVNDVSLFPDSPTQLTASWTEPTYACKGSTLGPYKVTWTPVGDTGTVDEDGTSFTISDLVPCTNYTVNVAATSNTGITGKMRSNTIELPNEVPGKSTIVTNGDITPHSLKVEWKAPLKVPPNGNNCPITKYIVKCATVSGDVLYEHTIMDPKQLSDTFNDLEACTKYNITVIAYTETGGTDSDTVSVETGTNAPPVDAVSITPASKSAHITWDRPSDTNCELVYEVTYTGTTMWTNNKTDDEGGLDPIDNPDTTVSADLDKLLAYTSYEICVTVRTGNTTCNTTETEMEVPTAPRNIAVKEVSISEVSLALTWEYPEAENGILLEYWVYWELEGESSNNYTDSVTANNTSYTISDLDEGTYIFKVIAVNSKGNSLWSDKIEQWMDGPSPACGGGCIAGIVIGILLVALIIPAFIFRDRIKEKIIPGSSPVEESPYELRGAAILKTDFRQHVEQLGLDRAESAYQMLNDESQQKDKFAATKPFNKGKNRFANIHPFDQTRVKLTLIRNGPKGSDYINANHITFPDTFELEFIATQGPLDSTINDFWRMIWEHNVYDTVMLCNLFEKGKSKCAQYWTENGERSMEFGEFKISCQAEEEDMSKTFITRYIDVFKDGQHRMVKQHHFLAWPDFGVPENEEGLLRFLSFVQKNVNQHGKKVLTHCSAGVGRTGTFIALWVLTSLLHQNKAAKSIDVHKIALMMREGRSDMIQTKDQYLYLHKCLLKYMEDAGNSFLISNKDEEEPIYGNVNTGFQQ